MIYMCLINYLCVVDFVFPNEVQDNDNFLSEFYLHRFRPEIKEPNSITTFRQPILKVGPQALFSFFEEKWAEAHLLKWEKPIPLAFLANI